MARLFTTTFEQHGRFNQRFEAEAYNPSGAVPDFTNQFDGDSCVYAAAGGTESTGIEQSAAGAMSFYLAAAVKFNAAISSKLTPTSELAFVWHNVGGEKLLYLDPNGQVVLYDPITATVVKETGFYPEGGRYYIYDLGYKMPLAAEKEAGTKGWMGLRVYDEQGRTVCSIAQIELNNGGTAPFYFQFGRKTATDTAIKVFVSHIRMNSSEGANQNSYCGYAKVAYQHPISDKERVGATSGSGATTGFYALMKRYPEGLNTKLPEVRSVGTVIAAAAATAIPGTPAGIEVGDLLILAIESGGTTEGGEATNVPSISGWTQLFSEKNGNTRLTVLYQVCTTTNPGKTIPSTGNHTLARMLAVKKGTFSATNPFNTSAYGTQAATKAVSMPTITTTLANTLIISFASGALPDATTTAEFSAETNANLASVTERVDNTTAEGDGGALLVSTGLKVTIGATGATTATAVTEAVRVVAQAAINPASRQGSQIVMATNATTDKYIANLQTYEEVGVGINDLVVFTRQNARLSNSSTTSRNMAIKGTNPTAAEATLTTGTVAAANDEGFPANGWNTKLGPLVNLPTIERQASPTLEIRKATASTDVMSVDGMGQFVEFVPNCRMSEFLRNVPVVDSLQRAEQELLSAGRWEGSWANSGVVRATGWSQQDASKYASARYMTEELKQPSYGVVTLAKALTSSHVLSVILCSTSTRNDRLAMNLEYVSATEVKVAILSFVGGVETNLGSVVVPYSEGDRFAFTAEEGRGGLRAWRQSKGTGAFSSIITATESAWAKKGGFAELGFSSEQETGEHTTRVTNAAFGSLPQRINWATVGSMENLIGWGTYGTGSTVSYDTAHVHDGTKSLKVTVNGAERWQGTGNAGLNLVKTVEGGRQMTISFWVWAEGNIVGRKLEHNVSEYTGGEESLIANESFQSQALVAGWNRISHTWTLSSTTVTFILSQFTGESISGGAVWWLDSVLVEYGSVLNPYFDWTTSPAAFYEGKPGESGCKTDYGTFNQIFVSSNVSALRSSFTLPRPEGSQVGNRIMVATICGGTEATSIPSSYNYTKIADIYSIIGRVSLFETVDDGVTPFTISWASSLACQGVALSVGAGLKVQLALEQFLGYYGSWYSSNQFFSASELHDGGSLSPRRENALFGVIYMDNESRFAVQPPAGMLSLNDNSAVDGTNGAHVFVEERNRVGKVGERQATFAGNVNGTKFPFIIRSTEPTVFDKAVAEDGPRHYLRYQEKTADGIVAYDASGNGLNSEYQGLPVRGQATPSPSETAVKFNDPTNLIAPGTFEAGIENWFPATLSSIKQTTELQHSGLASLKVSGNGESVNEGAGVETPAALTPGQQYTFTIWVYREAGKALLLESRCVGAEDIASKAFTAAATGWAMYRLTFRANQAKNYRLYVRTNEAPEQSRKLYLDDARLAIWTQAISTPSNTLLNVGDTWTLELLFRLDREPPLGAEESFTAHLLTKGSNAFSVRINNEGVIEVLKENVGVLGYFAVEASEKMKAGIWYHLVVTKATTTLKVYVNGVEAKYKLSEAMTKGERPTENTTKPLSVAKATDGNEEYGPVTIRRSAVYPTALSQERAKTHYETLSGRKLTISLEDAVVPAESRGKRDAMKRADAFALAEGRGSSDAMRRADALASVSESRVKAPVLSRKDSQALADAIRRSVSERRPETIALAELMKRSVNHRAAETQTLVDGLRRSLGLRKADAQVIVDVMRRRAGKTLKDGAAPGDSRRQTVGKRPKDAVTPTEALTKADRKRIAEGLVLAELLAHAWFARRKLTDTIPLSDSFVYRMGKALKLADTTALQEAVLHAWAARRKLADTLAPSDARKLRAALVRRDTSAVVDVIRRAAKQKRKDSLTLSDARRLAARKRLAESVGLADVVKLLPQHVLSIGDAQALSDAVRKAWKAKLSRADTFGAADLMRRVGAKRLQESFGTGDAYKRSWRALRSAADIFAVADAIKSFALARRSSPHDSAHVEDALKRGWRAIWKKAEMIAVSDRKGLGATKFLREGFRLGDANLRSLAKHQAAQIALVDHLQQAISMKRKDTLSLIDRSPKRVAKPFANLVFASDARSNRYLKGFSSAASANDALKRKLGFAKRDQVTPVEARRLGFGRPLRDGLKLGDGSHREYTLRVRDSVMPLDYRTRATGMGKRETMSLHDAIDVFRVLGVHIHDAVAIADGLRKDEIKALVELARLEDQAGVHVHAAHLAILALVDYLQTSVSLDDAAALLGELDDRAATTLQVEDGRE